MLVRTWLVLKIKSVWRWIGFSDKTLWDWLQLLIIPVALGLAALWFADKNSKTEQALAEDASQEAALLRYYDDISKLLIDYDLRNSDAGDEVRTIARIRTLSVLRRLNGVRKGYVIVFLYESGLITASEPILSLKNAYLRGMVLNFADLRGIDLHEVDLRNSDLTGTDFEGADLSIVEFGGANIQSVNFRRTNLTWTSLVDTLLVGSLLENANLTYANLSNADLRLCHLENTIIDNIVFNEATIWPEGYSAP